MSMHVPRPESVPTPPQRPSPVTPFPGVRVRCSDAERNRVTEQLQVHYVDGRLWMDEYEQRLAAALAATYVDELPMLLAELPPIPPNRLPSTRSRRHFCTHRIVGSLGLTALVTALFVGVLSVPDANMARFMLLSMLALPISIGFALILGLPCPWHGKKQGA